MAKLITHYVNDSWSNEDSGGEYFEHTIDALAEANRRAWQWCEPEHPTTAAPVITKHVQSNGTVVIKVNAIDYFGSTVVYTLYTE